MAPELTERERDVARLLLLGYDNFEIARELRLARRTVKAYLNRMFLKFEIRDGIKRVKLAVILYRRRLEFGLEDLPAPVVAERSHRKGVSE